METVIKKAIEGGWKKPEHWPNEWIDSYLLDRLFWQALIKDKMIDCWACKGKNYFEDFFTKEIDKDKPCGNCEQTGTQIESNWKSEWHRFLDHLADGKDIDSFFQELLPPAPTG